MTQSDKGCVLVSGSRGLIGSALTRELLTEGFSVVGLDNKPRESVAPQKSGNLIDVEGDVCDPLAVEEAILRGEAEFGPLRGAAHCAYPKSKNFGEDFESSSLGSLTEDLSLQLAGSMIFSQKVSIALKKRGGGSLVLLASIQGVRAPKFWHYEGTQMSSPAIYSVVKSGVIAHVGWLARYLRGTGIRVNAVSPGGIEADQPLSFREKYSQECVSKGLLEPQDVVGAICFLLSDASAYVTGQNIVVDDGWSL